jgi:hypothetical protein
MAIGQQMMYEVLIALADPNAWLLKYFLVESLHAL